MHPQHHIAATIHRYGIAVMGSHDDRYNFAYTIGLTEIGLPELLIFGPRMETSHVILNVAAHLMRERGEFKDGDVTDELANMSTAFKTIHPTIAKKYACQAAYRYLESPIRPRYLQVVIPDRAGKLPWDEGFDSEHMGKSQPQLWLV